MTRLLLMTTLLAATSCVADTRLGLNVATPRFVPFDQTTSPGVYGHAMTAGRATPPALQAVRVVTSEQARVTLYGTTQPAGLMLSNNDVFGVQVGSVYRLKLDEMAGYPGVEIYPTIELVDQLHPPEGQAAAFPVIVEITADEIEAALTNRLVTKVVYVRGRNSAVPQETESVVPTTNAGTRDNLVQAAMNAGRPIAVIRLGGRTPVGPNDQEFFVGGPVEYPVTR